MGFFIPDIARTPEDFEQCAELVKRLSATSAMPQFGQKHNLTYVLRDEENRQQLHGLTHVEWAPEVRCMFVDPEYKYQTAAFTLLHRGMEMNLRTTGTARYYFTAPVDHERVIKNFKRDGATIIDADMVRFVKVL